VIIHDIGVNQDGTGFDPNVAVDAASRIRETGGKIEIIDGSVVAWMLETSDRIFRNIYVF
jgi:hypothetical protein